jgi:peptidoglycan L-alanyl-D-glutamate endopeptidase CwlK
MALLHGERLTDVDPTLITIIKRAVAKVPFDVTVIEGVRSDEQVLHQLRQGPHPGRVHQGQLPGEVFQSEAGEGDLAEPRAQLQPPQEAWQLRHAVDLFPGTWEVKTGGAYDVLKAAVFAEAKVAGVKLRWGADWNQNGKCREHGETDNPHFELV